MPRVFSPDYASILYYTDPIIRCGLYCLPRVVRTSGMWEAPQVPNSSIPNIAPTVEYKITLAYSSPILFGFGTSGASHIPESLHTGPG